MPKEIFTLPPSRNLSLASMSLAERKHAKGKFGKIRAIQAAETKLILYYSHARSSVATLGSQTFTRTTLKFNRSSRRFNGTYLLELVKENLL